MQAEGKIAAIVVTYNRLELLQETIQALEGQTYPASEIVVINNGSTDGTGKWLDEQSGLTVIHQQNMGGSGGFHTGLRYAAQHNFAWAWVMDDDTICMPDTLQKLVEKLPLVKEPIGFIGSKCVWTDGTPHLMNLPPIHHSFSKELPFNQYDDKGLLLTKVSSFVSLLINVKAVKAVGLPYKEFFIWGDDQEYTRRITGQGYLGMYCKDSIALHKTPVNYFPDFYNDVPGNLWKHSYGFRNEFFMVKRNKGLLYYLGWLFVKLNYTSYKLLRIRKDHQLKFLSVLWSAGWRSLFFNPKIDLQ